MRFNRFCIILLIFLTFSCERRIFLDKIPQIIYENDRYVFESYGHEYDRIFLSSETSVIELSSCRENISDIEVLHNTEPGFYDLFLITGKDTVLVSSSYLGNCGTETLKITALDVYQGDCFIISPPDDIPSVIDGGFGSLGYEVWQGSGEKILLEHLESQSWFDLNYLIETHHHEDHYGGLFDLTGDLRFSFVDYLTYDSELLEPGDTLYFSPTVKGVVVHSGLINGDTETDENDKSVVIKLLYGDFEMIFTGDITENAEEFILSGTMIDADEEYEVLKVAHHGSKYASGDEFLNTVLPVFSIISAGAGNPHGHPTEEVIERLKDVNSSVLRTDINGTVEIYSDGSSFQISYSR